MKNIFLLSSLFLLLNPMFGYAQEFVACALDQSITVVSRSADPNGDLDLPLDGPFYMNETISICYDVNFDNSATTCQWFQGIIPKFGMGWDLSSFNPEIDLPTPGSNWSWLSQGEMTYNAINPFLCLSTNEEGALELCHENFEPNCDCSVGLEVESELPAGWFYYSSAVGVPDCESTGPNTSFGYPQACNSSLEFQVCFEIKTKTYDNVDNCESLYMSFYPFADGETGCWYEADCAGDSIVYKSFELDCESVIAGIDSKINLQEFNIYPVPTTEFINLKFVTQIQNQPRTIIIENMLSQTCMTKYINNASSKIDLSELKPGVYYLSVIEKGKKIGVKKLVKMGQ